MRELRGDHDGGSVRDPCDYLRRRTAGAQVDVRLRTECHRENGAEKDGFHLRLAMEDTRYIWLPPETVHVGSTAAAVV